MPRGKRRVAKGARIVAVMLPAVCCRFERWRADSNVGVQELEAAKADPKLKATWQLVEQLGREGKKKS
jgi:hypothetical protein